MYASLIVPICRSDVNAASQMEWFFCDLRMTCGESMDFLSGAKPHACGKPLKNPNAVEYRRGVPETFDVAAQPRGLPQPNPLLQWLVKTTPAGQTYET